MTAFLIEFSKLRRKHAWLLSMGAAAVCLFWMSASVVRSNEGATDGMTALLFDAPLINAIVMTLFATIITSRVCEVDHEAHALKELLCLREASALFAAKLLCALTFSVIAIALETAGMAALAAYKNYSDQLSLTELVTFAATQLAPTFTVAALVQAIALRWENQFATLAVGLALSLAGLFSMFFPPAFQRLVPSGYFGLLSCVRMEWDPSAQAVSYVTVPFSWGDTALLAGICTAVIVVSAIWFSRKEL